MDEATDGYDLLVPALPPPLNDQGSGRAGDGGSRGGGSRSGSSADGADDDEEEQQHQRPPKKKAARRKSRKPIPWEARIEELRFFKNLTGHCKVPWCYAANPSLASWVDNQRRQRKLKYEGKTSSLTDEREATLDEMGFWWGFGGGKRIPTFEDRIEELRQWREGRVGDTNDDDDDGGGTTTETTFAPMAIMGGQDKKKASPEIKSLHEWARTQEVRFQEGKLSLEREAALRAVGLRLAPRDPSAAYWNWQEGYSRIVAYKEKFGHCNVTGTEGGAEYEKLKIWVDRQRSKYSRRDDGGGGRKHLRKSSEGAEGGSTPRTVSILKDHEVADLQKIGFLFKKWDIMYDKLERWRADRGPDEPLPHPNKNCKLDEDDPERELKAWIQLQRSNFRKWQTGKLSDNSELMTPERISKLLKVGVDLLPTSVRRKPSENFLIERTLWRVKLDELRAYRDHFGNCDVPLDFALNKALGKWAKEQRVQYELRKEGKPNALTDERLYDLLGVGFSFDKAQPPSSSSSEKNCKCPRYGGEAAAAPSEAAPAVESSSSSLIGKKRPRNSEKSAASAPAEVSEKKKKEKKKHSKDSEKRSPSAAAPAPAEVSAKKKRYCTWEERLEQCRKYREEHGHLSVRKDHKDLGDWAYRQRIAYGQKKMGKLSPLTDEKERQLEKLGFDWETTTNKTTTKSAAAEESAAEQQQVDEPHRKKRAARPTVSVAPPGGGRGAKKAGTSSKASAGTKESKKRGGRPARGAAAQSNQPSEEESAAATAADLGTKHDILADRQVTGGRDQGRTERRNEQSSSSEVNLI